MQHQFDPQALIEEIKVMMKEHPKGFRISQGKYGAIDAIPIELWSSGESENLDINANIIQRWGKMDQTTRRSLVSRALPRSVETLLLRSAEKDLVAPTVACHSVQFPYSVSFKYLGLDEHSEWVHRDAIKGMMALGIQSFFGNFLGRGEDAVKATIWPGDPNLNLSRWQRLAFGVSRELIYDHFDSVTEFWKSWRELMEVGISEFSIKGPQGFNRAYVEYLLRDDPNAMKVYELLIDIGCNDQWIDRSLNCMRKFALHFGPGK